MSYWYLYGMYGYNGLFMLIFIAVMIFAVYAQIKVKRTFKKYSGQYSERGITGAEAARRVLDANGLSDVPVQRISGELSDHYDRSTNIVSRSDSVYSGTSTASIGVACHEVGHAIQNARNYIPGKIRMAIVPITNVGTRLAIPLIIAGLILSIFSQMFIWVAYIGLIGFALSVVFQLVTLPTEFDASRRAIVTIRQQGILTEHEVIGARRVLTAAALTYVAALAVSLMQFLRFALIILGRRD